MRFGLGRGGGLVPRRGLAWGRGIVYQQPPMAGRRPRLVYAVTHPVTADVLLRGQLAFMREQGFEVTVVGAPGPELERVREREDVRVVAVPMARQTDPRRDLVSLARLTQVFRELRPDIVNAGTTKAGLLGMMAARAVSTPVRIYLLRGLRLETAKGAMRVVLAGTERIACACAHDVICNSPSLLRLAVGSGHVPARKAVVLGHGSSNGVDTDRYQRSEELRARGVALFEALGVPEDAPVVGFVGRLAWDKGITELLDAFEIVRREVPTARLVMLGGDLGGEVAEDALAARVRGAPGVVSTPHILDLAPYYARMDVLAFPSFREGFPNAVCEAQSAETPVVGFRSTGVIDAVADGETGALVDQGDVRGLAARVISYLRSPELARAHGRAARLRAVGCYDRALVWNTWLEAYRERLAARGLPLPVGG